MSCRLSCDWTWIINVELLSGRPPGTNFSGILTEIHIFSLQKIHWKCCLSNGGHLSVSHCVRYKFLAVDCMVYKDRNCFITVYRAEQLILKHMICCVLATVMSFSWWRHDMETISVLLFSSNSVDNGSLLDESKMKIHFDLSTAWFNLHATMSSYRLNFKRTTIFSVKYLNNEASVALRFA